MDFDSFRHGAPALHLFDKLGLGEYLRASRNWCMLRHLIVEWNDRHDGDFIKRARQLDGVASSGERVLLHAILCAVDFAWLADELAGGRAWRNMGNVSGQHQRAVAACLLLADAG